MSYPLTVRFKILAIARQLAVYDSSQRLLMYVKQKAFKLKESITVFADEQQTRPLYTIAADRMIDFSATYNITSVDGVAIGAIRQKGMQSLWRSRYEIVRDDAVVFTAREENPWSKVADGLFEGIPVVGMLSGYIFHPRYLISRGTDVPSSSMFETPEGGDVARATKQPAFLESVFTIERLPTPLDADEERLLLISTVAMILLERRRG